MKRLCYGVWVLLCLAGISPLRAFAETRTWNGPANGDWFLAANWLPGGAENNYPQAGDTVAITNGAVLLTNSTFELSSLTITNATLVFSNWTTRLRATTVNIWSNGILTLPGAFTEAQMSNRVWIVCADLTLWGGGSLNADGRGYDANQGPGKGSMNGNMWYPSGGGGHGGQGGRGVHSDGTVTAGGGVYGDAQEPTAPGSGGGNNNSTPPGAGGGAVRIEASGQVSIDGTISANGRDSSGNNAAGGSGGSIFISCDRFGGGASGLVRANGGWGTTVGAEGKGGGGGGRIAVHYTTLDDVIGVRFSARYGDSYDSHWGVNRNSGSLIGSVYFSSTLLIERVLAARNGNSDGINGEIRFGSTNTWSSTALSRIANSALGIATGNLWRIESACAVQGQGVVLGREAALQLATNTVVSNAAIVLTAYSILTGGSDLLLTNQASLLLISGATNGMATTYGALMDIAGRVTLTSNTWILPVAHSSDGGAPLLRAGEYVIQRYGGINANALGYGAASGPGKGANSSSQWYPSGGGGYGGKGGTGYSSGGGAVAGGQPYGRGYAPIDPGSGGGNPGGTARGGRGGGMIRIETAGSLDLAGSLTANGANGIAHNGGGGSGGGVHIICNEFQGAATAVMSANGGNGAPESGAGGGGRIAAWVGLSNLDKSRVATGNYSRVTVTNVHKYYLGTFSVTNGSGYTNSGSYSAESGSCWFYIAPPPLGIIIQVM